MKVELISVGTELLLGDITNTNSRYLSQQLALVGADVIYHTTVGDNAERLTAALENAFSRVDTVILTGGLGPTDDDITKEVCTEFFRWELILDRDTEDKIREYFAARGIDPMPESNLKQAMVPDSATVLDNANGTAPGFIMNSKGRCIIILPGPPSEMKPMFERYIRDYLAARTRNVIISGTVRTFGIGESLMSEKVSDLLKKRNPTVAPYAKTGEALLRITAKAATRADAEEMILDTLKEIFARLGDYVYGFDVDSLEEATVMLLKEKKLTAAFAESCTAGLCAKRITDISGASEVFQCGIVSYSNEIKEKILGVNKEHLDRYGAVSGVVAAEMALGVKKLSGAHFGVSVTGMAGPTSDDPEKPVGLIYIAVTDGEKLWLKEYHGRSSGESCRDYNRFAAASNAINELRLTILNRPERWSEGVDIHNFIRSF